MGSAASRMFAGASGSRLPAKLPERLVPGCAGRLAADGDRVVEEKGNAAGAGVVSFGIHVVGRASDLVTPPLSGLAAARSLVAQVTLGDRPAELRRMVTEIERRVAQPLGHLTQRRRRLFVSGQDRFEGALHRLAVQRRPETPGARRSLGDD